MPQQDGGPKRSWQDIAQDASRERDPDRLLRLTKELEQALDERDKLPAQTVTQESKRESA